jgi:hypothetical protein
MAKKFFCCCVTDSGPICASTIESDSISIGKFVYKTHEFVYKTHEFVDKTHEFVDKTHEFADKTHEFADKAHEFVDTGAINSLAGKFRAGPDML